MGGPGSGGRRTYSGPPPDMNALKRQRDGKDWTRLPAAGRLDPAPEWPAAIPEPSEAEALKWREMWTYPQALIWEADRAFDLVAFYVRTYLEAMHPRAGAQARMFVRQLSNDLYLAPAALTSGRYVIQGTDEDRALQNVLASTGTAGKPGRPRGSARNRLTIVEPEPDEEDENERTDTARPETDGEVPPF